MASSDVQGKRQRYSSSDDVPNKHGKIAVAANLDQRISILEQRIYELQSFTFDGAASCDTNKFISPGVVYADPLINLEISVLRQKEESL